MAKKWASAIISRRNVTPVISDRAARKPGRSPETTALVSDSLHLGDHSHPSLHVDLRLVHAGAVDHRRHTKRRDADDTRLADVNFRCVRHALVGGLDPWFEERGLIADLALVAGCERQQEV